MNTIELKTFLEDDSSEIRLPMMPLEDIVEAMVELGFPEEDYEYDTNGWQCDFWLEFTKTDYQYKVTFSGSLYYGGYKVSKELLTQD